MLMIPMLLLRGAGGDPHTLPTGPIASWDFSTFNASAQNLIANAASSVTPSTNRLHQSARFYNSTIFWTKSGVTVTDGVSDSTIVSANSAGYLIAANGTNLALPAGAWGLGIDVISNTGSDQTFKLQDFQQGKTSSILTATTSWQRFWFPFTATAGASQPRIMSDGTNGYAIRFKNFGLHPGATDPGEPVADGHLYLGRWGSDSFTLSNGAIDLGAATVKWGLAQWAANKSLSAATIVAIVKKTAAGGSTIESILSNMNNGGYTDLLAALDDINRPGSLFAGGASPAVAQKLGTTWQFNGTGFHVFIMTATSTLLEVWIDGFKLVSFPITTTTPFNLSDIMANAANGISVLGDLSYQYMGVWDRLITDAEGRSATLWCVDKAALNSNAIATSQKYLTVTGDSRSVEATWPGTMAAAASPSFIGTDFALSGQGRVLLQTRAAQLTRVPTTGLGSQHIILIGPTGVNDYTTDTDANAYADTIIGGVIDSLIASGRKVLLCTELPSTRAGFNTWRGTLNTKYMSQGGVTFHGATIIPLHTSVDFGADADASDAAKYGDGTHPTTLTNGQISAFVTPYVNAAW